MARLTFLGNFRVEYTSEYEYAEVLEAMGHKVIRLQETETTGEQVLAEALKSDGFFWVSTHSWRTPGLPMREVLRRLKEAHIPSFTWHLDLWLGLQRQTDMKNDYFKIEHFFTVDKEMADLMNSQKDMPKGYYLPAAVADKHCHYGEVKPEYKHDVIFTGSYEYHREWRYRQKLLDFLHKTYGSRFKRYGHPGRDQKDIKVVMGGELNDLYASAKIVIGDTLCPNFTKPYYFSNRSFEVTGKGGFLIHPYVKGLEECFELGQEIVTYKYGDFKELKDKIDYYLYADQERTKIKLAGHERTKEYHTFTNRLDYMLDKIGLTA